MITHSALLGADNYRQSTLEPECQWAGQKARGNSYSYADELSIWKGGCESNEVTSHLLTLVIATWSLKSDRYVVSPAVALIAVWSCF